MKTKSLILLIDQNRKLYARLTKEQAFDEIIASQEKLEVIGNPFESYIVLSCDVNDEAIRTLEIFNSCDIDYVKRYNERISVLENCNFSDITELYNEED